MAALWFCLTLFAETAPGRAGAAAAEVLKRGAYLFAIAGVLAPAVASLAPRTA